MNQLPEELVRSLQSKRLWRPLNTYGLIAIAVVAGYMIALL